MPWRSATCQIVSPGAASTSVPSRKKRIGSVIGSPPMPSSPQERGSRNARRIELADLDSRLRGNDELVMRDHVNRSSRKCFSTCLTGFIAAWPRPQIEASLITCVSSSSKRLVPVRRGQQLDGLLGAGAARRALAAALVLEEAQQVQRHRLHVVLVGEDDHRGRADEAAVGFERAEIERDVGQSPPAGCRPRRRPADSP